MAHSLGSRRTGSGRDKKRVITRDTEWGFIVERGGSADRRAYWGEVAALIGVFVFGAVAYAQWLWPGTEASPELFPFRMAITVVFFVMSAWLYFIARNGLKTEIQVDVSGGKIGVVRRNKEGFGALEDRFSFDDVESFYIKRGARHLGTGGLFARVRNRSADVQIASAAKKELEPLMERLRGVCRPTVFAKNPAATTAA